eukprot:7064319-Prymnesium_polylepis.1
MFGTVRRASAIISSASPLEVGSRGMSSPRARRSHSSSLMRSTVSCEMSVWPAVRFTWSAMARARAFAAAR